MYQIYPRSFQDSNADGIGDLPGITRRLDYIARLGVDAIWISPFFKSPMADFGYDIADFRDVDPIFGTLADFDTLLAEAHHLGLKVIIDQVPSHTSIAHAWFQQSRASRDNAKADWYVWADPRDDGTPPNNWLSIFGGSAWQWEPRRQQYYLHNFLPDQPDLNFHEPDVSDAVLGNLRFWLERGVDGFRLDSINFCFHDRLLRDNPAKPAHQRFGRGYSEESPYAYQYHWFNNTQPENLAFLQRLRQLLDHYPNAVALGEVSSEDSLATMAEYTGNARLHMSYSFELLTDQCSAGFIRNTVEALEQQMPHGWPCWAISNHDCVRVRSRWLPADAPCHAASVLTALACSLRGSVCVYQGEELGLPEADVPYHALRDPYGIAFWPNSKGRDGCRTPMPWQDAEFGGFSTCAPWLPIDAPQRGMNVAMQESLEHSPLQRFLRFMQWRRNQPSLQWGDIQFLDAPEPLLGFVRTFDNETMLAIFNLGNEAMTLELPPGIVRVHDDHGLPCAIIENGTIRFGGYSVLFADVESRAAIKRLVR
ncbi:MAG TPA: alpha-glucosidase [Rhodanobacteraceae bacterium]